MHGFCMIVPLVTWRVLLSLKSVEFSHGQIDFVRRGSEVPSWLIRLWSRITHCAVCDRASSAVAPSPEASWGIPALAVEPAPGGGHAGPASPAQAAAPLSVRRGAPKVSRFTGHEKIDLVKRAMKDIDSGMGQLALANRLGVSQSMLSKWIREYKKGDFDDRNRLDKRARDGYWPADTRAVDKDVLAEIKKKRGEKCSCLTKTPRTTVLGSCSFWIPMEPCTAPAASLSCWAMRMYSFSSARRLSHTNTSQSTMGTGRP